MSDTERQTAGKNLEVFSPTIGRQLLDLGLIDEIDLHIAPILLGEGIRLYDNPGTDPIRLLRVGDATRRRPSTCVTDPPRGKSRKVRSGRRFVTCRASRTYAVRP